ncbi:MAG: hypothetical protein ACLP8S_18125 [Solirubrobacteraceae bacterium]
MRFRRRLVAALVVVASLALLLAVLGGYVDRVAINPQQFANRATVVLRDPSVRNLIADRITNEILDAVPDLVAVRPIVHSVLTGIVGTTAFTDLFHSAALAAHAELVNGSASKLTLRLANLGAVLSATLQQFDPSAARAVQSAQIVLLSRNVGSFAATIAHAANTIKWLWMLLALLFLACAAIAVTISRPRRRAIRRLGVGIAAVGVLLFIGLLLGRRIAIDQVQGTDARAAVGAVWDAYLAGLRTASLVLGAIGVVAAVIARGGKPELGPLARSSR